MTSTSDWSRIVGALEKAGRLGSIDWRSEPDELQEALDPLLAQQGVTLDWSFVAALDEAGDWEALKNENFLPRVAAEVAKHGLVMAHINEGTDAYVFAVCTPEEFVKIDGVSEPALFRSIGRFA